MGGIEASADTIELTVPELGDLGDRAVVARWTKRVGERVAVDEPICRLAVGDLEFEVCSTADGEVSQIFADEGVAVLENTSLAQVLVDAPAAAELKPQEDAVEEASGGDDAAPPRGESIEVEPIDPEFAPPQPADEQSGEDEPAAEERVVSIEVEPIDPEFAPPAPDEAQQGTAAEPAPASEPSPSQPSSRQVPDPPAGLAPAPPGADVAPPAGGLEAPTGPDARPHADPPLARPEPPPAAEPAPGEGPLPSGDDVDWSGWISPVVQALADEHDLNLAEIRGTGIGGRIRKRDVLRYLESRQRSGGV